MSILQVILDCKKNTMDKRLYIYILLVLLHSGKDIHNYIEVKGWKTTELKRLVELVQEILVVFNKLIVYKML